jgi:hypothetical protein
MVIAATMVIGKQRTHTTSKETIKMRQTHRFGFSLVVMLIAAAICGGSEIRTPAHASTDATDFGGFYYLHGKAPAGLKGFASFDLTTAKYIGNSVKPIPIKPYGVVHAGRNYKMARINIAGDALLFETVNLAGITYKFSGKLTRSDDPNAPTLKGWLSKSVNGKTVAEAEVGFVLEEGD